MKRRPFLVAAATGAGLTSTALRAQGGPVEGREYSKLAQPLAVSAAGKVEVVEFFGYWCPHCNSFEPTLEPWVKALPAHVAFRRVPVAFRPDQELHQKLYYAIEALGLLEVLHRKVFAAMHVDRKRLDKEADIGALAQANGADGAKLLETMKSFSVSSKVRQARQLAEGYRVDSVPMIGVHGRFVTSVAQANGPQQALAVTEHLIRLAGKA
ncbi:MAG: thiol:disulfide interchange protein DsbA/DsbL [Aquabacterium sp.]